MTPICFVDCETTSLRPDRRAWEIGMIRRDTRGEHVAHVFVEIDAINLPAADPVSLEVGKFWQRHPQAQAALRGDDASFDMPGEAIAERADALVEPGTVVSRWRAARLVSRFTQGAHLVGAVPSFDDHVLSGLLRGCNFDPSWHYRLLDVETLAVGWLAAGGRSMSLPWRSDDVSRAVGVEPPGPDARHTALGDARWAAQIYDRVLGGVV